jgi:hypothetical protein
MGAFGWIWDRQLSAERIDKPTFMMDFSRGSERFGRIDRTTGD